MPLLRSSLLSKLSFRKTTRISLFSYSLFFSSPLKPSLRPAWKTLSLSLPNGLLKSKNLSQSPPLDSFFSSSPLSCKPPLKATIVPPAARHLPLSHTLLITEKCCPLWRSFQVSTIHWLLQLHYLIHWRPITRWHVVPWDCDTCPKLAVENEPQMGVYTRVRYYSF